MTWEKWLQQAVNRLRISSNSSSAKCDAEILLAKVTGESRTRLLAFGETPLTDTQRITLDVLLNRRELGEPIAYLIGEREFWSLNLRVSRDTLIPRPDTECLVQFALTLPIPEYAAILDLGTGNGAIALALATERPKWTITGVDVSLKAVKIACDNAVRLGLRNIKFQTSDWFKELQGQCYNLIVGNPPYIKEGDPHLNQGDVRFESRRVLVSGEDGLKDLKEICQSAFQHLIPGGWLLLEHGWNQGKAVRDLFTDAGFIEIYTICDYGNHERASHGRRFSMK